jgi:hypothetical protein
MSGLKSWRDLEGKKRMAHERVLYARVSTMRLLPYQASLEYKKGFGKYRLFRDHL